MCSRTPFNCADAHLDIPDVIQVDITSLEQGGAGLTYGDLPVPANVEMLEKASVTCVAVQ